MTFRGGGLSAPLMAAKLILSAELSSQQGREPRTTNMVLGNDQSVDAWRELDKKVNLVVAAGPGHTCVVHFQSRG